MHYVSWDRSDRTHPALMVEAGPEQLAVFSADAATVDSQSWQLEVDKNTGATATWEGGQARLEGRIGRAKHHRATVGEEVYHFLCEQGSDWIIEDASGEKVAQFSGKNSGMRRAILEFEGETALPVQQVTALAWFARLILEEKTSGMAIAWIASLALATVAAFLALIG